MTAPVIARVVKEVFRGVCPVLLAYDANDVCIGSVIAKTKNPAAWLKRKVTASERRRLEEHIQGQEW